MPHRPLPDAPPYKIFIGNIPYEATAPQLGELFWPELQVRHIRPEALGQLHVAVFSMEQLQRLGWVCRSWRLTSSRPQRASPEAVLLNLALGPTWKRLYSVMAWYVTAPVTCSEQQVHLSLAITDRALSSHRCFQVDLYVLILLKQDQKIDRNGHAAVRVGFAFCHFHVHRQQPVMQGCTRRCTPVLQDLSEVSKPMPSVRLNSCYRRFVCLQQQKWVSANRVWIRGRRKSGRPS